MAYEINVPNVTCGNGLHMQAPGAEPVFHFTQNDGYHGITYLRTIKSWALTMREDGVPLAELTSSLYILLPGSRDLIHCTLNVVDGDDGPELEIEALGTASLHPFVIYTCKL